MSVDKPHVLVVEDESPIIELVRYVLGENGWLVTVALTVDDAWHSIRSHLPDLVILDWMLGDKSGLALLSRIRGDRDLRRLPVIMLTAKSMDEDKLEGFSRGADDYITKPFSPRELAARVNAVLRRHMPEHDSAPITLGRLSLNPASCTVRVDDQAIEMGHSEYRLLKFLMSHPDRAFTRSQLLDKVWGTHAVIEERTVDVHVLRLRKALGEMETMIKTVRSVGYMFTEQ